MDFFQEIKKWFQNEKFSKWIKTIFNRSRYWWYKEHIGAKGGDHSFLLIRFDDGKRILCVHDHMMSIFHVFYHKFHEILVKMLNLCCFITFLPLFLLILVCNFWKNQIFFLHHRIEREIKNFLRLLPRCKRYLNS